MKKAAAAPKGLLIIFEIVLVVIVSSTLYFRVADFQEKNVLEKKFLSRDIALLLDVLPIVPGNMLYTYTSKTLDKFAVKFDRGVLEIDGEKYSYATDETFSYKELLGLNKKSKIFFYKSGKRIGAKEDESLFNPYEQQCMPDKLPIGKISVESVGTDAFSSNVAEFLKKILATTKEENIEKADTVVLVAKGTHSAVKIFVNQHGQKRKQSEALGCIIANELSAKMKDSINGIAIVPIDLTLYSPHDKRQELKENKIGILIELNEQIPVQTAIVEIKEGIEKYEK